MNDVERKAKALSHPLRRRILVYLGEHEPASPNRMASDLDEPLGNVSYHVKALLGFGCVELTGTEPRRGAVEHFYARTDETIASATDGDALDEITTIVVGVDFIHTPEDAIKAIEGVLEKTGRKVAAE